MEKKADTPVPLADLIVRRWSPRAFDAERAVERHKLHALLQAARWAPSCFGDEPWRYIVADRQTDETAWQKAFDLLAEGNQAWCKNVPVLLLACADSVFDRNGKPNRWGQYDTGAASENLCLEAVRQGLAAHQMGGFDVKRARQAYAIPERFTPMAMIAVGYQASADVLDAGWARDSELGPRERRPLEELVFEDGWEKPWHP